MKILNISDAAALAIHSMIILCATPEERVNLKEIAKILGASEHHLSKVMQRLVKVGIISSVRGPSGGFLLKKNALSKSVLEILEIFEGEAERNPCLMKREECVVGSCIYNDFLEKINSQVINYLSSYKLKDLLNRNIKEFLDTKNKFIKNREKEVKI